MALQDVIKADLQALLLELGEEVRYRRGEQEVTLQAVWMERALDDWDGVADVVREVKEFYLAKDDLGGLAPPQPHDVIQDPEGNEWEVDERLEDWGLYRLTCYRRLRPMP